MPIVLVPGIQGRWEWMAPAIDALGRLGPVLTFSLTECGPDRFFERWTHRIDELVAGAGARRVLLVGVSFGGIVALHYAARRPDRIGRLILVSAPSPLWRLDPGSARYVNTPRLALPLFALRGVTRLAPEVVSSLPTWRARSAFAAEYAWRALRWPASPARMAAWAREWMASDFVADCGAITAPTLLVTGDAHLDRVVPVDSTCEYLRLIPGSRHVVIPATGHLGLLTRPAEFAAAVKRFCDEG